MRDKDPSSLPPSAPPEAWPAARRVAGALARPLSRFLQIQAASGIVLLASAVVALVWANSPWRHLYEQLWHTPITVGIGPWISAQPLHFFINDGLMVVFFFVVGLEIRREIHEGELSDRRRAALPVAAAVGGMIAPALIYTAVNHGTPAQRGWGVPMATDIAFAVGVLALLGKRVPAAVRVLLLALAIIDDLGAIIVIALFYSSGFSFSGLAFAALGVLAVIVMRGFGVRRAVAYVPPGIVVWAGILMTGVHPTIAGVLLGLLTPVEPWFGAHGFVAAAEAAIADLRRTEARRHDDHELLDPLARVDEARREAVAPVVQIEAALHPWVAYGIMPLFALANAGVDLHGIDLRAPATTGIAAGVVAGLVVGKPIGILAASFLAERMGIAARPRGVTWRGVALVGLVAGIGFTMAIFIAGLAFPDPAALGAAKIAILAASAIVGVVALAAGRVLLAPVSDAVAVTVDEAERSTEE
ncbi:Na+/H+ antiporter NhaA type [Minicystis rosea]|nr:Na+/H+ antiporter NhaA type [Minicystis rosea]